ncbi:uracil-xanthine permease family protein [Nocardiopsis salina]|uniref:uracil-xanthine permease family protein n=1 Tax=Nocardiopsis salina TaxID=245836 RepID=UPI001EF9F898|nr:uracil-xanthine permease family protein [Nocardiopsis salina]
MSTTPRHPVDEYRPYSSMALFGFQHVLVMAAAPISSVFIISAALGLTTELTVNLLAAAFVLSGIGSVLQSLGLFGFGAKLPFVMLPGGAPVVLFIAIAQQHGANTAVGAVIITSLFYFVALPVFSRLLKFFPALVIGTMIVIVGINLVKISAFLVTGEPGDPDFGDPGNLLLGMATIGFTVLFFWLFTGVLRQIAVMLGFICGTLLAVTMGETDFSGATDGGFVQAPQAMPFGVPEFSLLAALPLLIYSLASMAETTGQTVVNAQAVGKDIDIRRDAPRTIRAEALTSLTGGFFGTPLMVCSGENIGIIRVTGVRSRFVTATAGVILVVIGFVAPITALVSAVPAPVVGGTAILVFGVVIVLGMQMLQRAALDDHTNAFIIGTALALGLLPILVPGMYEAFPDNATILLESGVAVSAVSAALLNVLFHHVRPRLHRNRQEQPEAVGPADPGPSSTP